MSVDWASLGMVVVVAAAATVTIVLLVCAALVAVSHHGPTPIEGAAPRRSVSGTVVAALCLVAAAVLIGYGLYLIVA